MTRSMIVILWRKHAKRAKMEHLAVDQASDTTASNLPANSRVPWNFHGVARIRAAPARISNRVILITLSENLMIPCVQFRSSESKDPSKNLRKGAKSLRRNWWHCRRGSSRTLPRSEVVSLRSVRLLTLLATLAMSDNPQGLFLLPEADFQIYATRTKLEIKCSRQSTK